MLVGREDEQQHLDRLLRQARAGTSRIVVLRGEPGIGKTALVDYAAARAETMQILRVTGIEAEAELAFAGASAGHGARAPRGDAGHWSGIPTPGV
jgi:predicted ATP-dependent serine protease